MNLLSLFYDAQSPLQNCQCILETPCILFSFKDGEEQWIDVTEEPLEYNYVETVTISDLKPNSIYQVRVFGFHKDEDLNQLNEPVVKDSIKIHTCAPQGKEEGSKNKGIKELNELESEESKVKNQSLVSEQD